MKKFNDPTAKLTKWNNLTKVSYDFRNTKIVKISPYKIEFRPTIRKHIFSGIFVFVGLITTGTVATSQIYTNQEILNKETIGAYVIGLGFIIIGYYLFSKTNTIITFDKAENHFKIGNTNLINLKTIHAIQIIKKNEPNGEFESYELNLVLKDGSRTNIANHGDLKSIRRDGAELAIFLNIPIWDIA